MRLAVAVLLLTGLSACAGAPTLAESEAARANTTLGLSYAREGKFELALDRLRKAINQDDGYPSAHAAIAFVYQALDEDRKADKHYRRALELDPENPETRNLYGVFLCHVERREEAQRHFEAAGRNRRYRNADAAWTNAGVCLKPVDPDRAEAAFREALRLRSDSPEALAQMAHLSYERKDYLRTRAFLQRYDLAKRAAPDLLWLAARTEQALGDSQAARLYDSRLRREFPDSKEAASVTESSQ